MITHAGVIRCVEWATDYFGLSATDRLSGHSPFHFDLSTFDLFGTFAVGAELHLVPPELNVLPHKFPGFIREAGLTQWFSVPSVLTLMAQLDVVRHDDLPTLRRLLWCGEGVPTPGPPHLVSPLPPPDLTNPQGAPEAPITSSHYSVERCPDDDRA